MDFFPKKFELFIKQKHKWNMLIHLLLINIYNNTIIDEESDLWFVRFIYFRM